MEDRIKLVGQPCMKIVAETFCFGAVDNPDGAL
jgi:hypothetical protein